MSTWIYATVGNLYPTCSSMATYLSCGVAQTGCFPYGNSATQARTCCGCSSSVCYGCPLGWSCDSSSISICRATPVPIYTPPPYRTFTPYTSYTPRGTSIRTNQFFPLFPSSFTQVLTFKALTLNFYLCPASRVIIGISTLLVNVQKAKIGNW